MKIGVLALQGDFAKHSHILEKLGTAPVRIRYPQELDEIQGLVFPGGESTTMTHLIEQNGFHKPLVEFARSYPVLGTCAGLILMASSVDDHRVNPLGLLDIDASRNAYGRQVFSFTDLITLNTDSDTTVEATFIRAPKITRVGSDITIVASYQNEPVGVTDGRHMALSFHPELTNYTGFHERTFLS